VGVARRERPQSLCRFERVLTGPQPNPKKKKKTKAVTGSSKAQSTFSAATGQVAPAQATTTATATTIATGPVRRAPLMSARVEELADDEE
jgi:translocation protein SEC62